MSANIAETGIPTPDQIIRLEVTPQMIYEGMEASKSIPQIPLADFVAQIFAVMRAEYLRGQSTSSEQQ